MKRYNYDTFVREKKEKYFALRAKLERKHLPRSRPRENDERNFLILRDRKRWQNWIKTGKLKELAPRCWRIKL